MTQADRPGNTGPDNEPTAERAETARDESRSAPGLGGEEESSGAESGAMGQPSAKSADGDVSNSDRSRGRLGPDVPRDVPAVDVPGGPEVSPGASGYSPEGGYWAAGAPEAAGYSPPGGAPEAGSYPPGGQWQPYPTGAVPEPYPTGGALEPYGQGGYPPGAYPPGYAAPGWSPPRPTNGMAIASLVLGILWIYWVGSILALIFGYQARKQIAQRGEEGSGLATAGIVLGWIGVAILGVVLVFVVVAATVSAFN